MWNTVNNPTHPAAPSTNPKWIPYVRPGNILTDLPPESFPSEPVRVQVVENMVPATEESQSDSDSSHPIIRRIAPAPLQYQETISREHSNHSHPSKQQVVKKRVQTDSSKNLNPPRIHATVSTVSWREELKHFESAFHLSSQHGARSPRKNSNQEIEENHAPKQPAKSSSTSKDDVKVTKSSVSVVSSTDQVNGPGRQTKQRNMPSTVTSRSSTSRSPKKASSSGAASLSSTANPSQLKTETNYEGIKALMETIAAVNMASNITRSHVDVSGKGVKDSILQSKKRSISENNLTTHPKFDQACRRTSPLKPIPAGGKLRSKVLKTQQSMKRGSPRKVEPTHGKKILVEVAEVTKERQKSYDPKKAREYIKQQRCERMDRLREEKERKRADEEARKHKLSELNRTTHKLLQASIKKKPLLLTHAKTAMPSETGNLRAPSTTLVPKSASTTSDAPAPTPATQAASSSGNGLYIYPGPSHPVVSDSAVKQNIIKDVGDMKATMDTLLNSLKSAIQLKAGSLPQEKKKPSPTIVDLKDNSELRIGATLQDDVKIQPKPLAVQKPLLIPETFDSTEVQHLTNNLRKMRENFRSVILAQDPPKREKRKPDNKLRSTESEVMETNYAEKRRLQQWLHKLPATTQSAMEVPTQRGPLSGSSSEVDKIGFHDIPRRPRRRRTKSSHNSHHRLIPVIQCRETSDDSIQENLSGGPLDHAPSPHMKSESDTGSIPEWLKPLASEPYPVSFMSVVKRKLSQMASKKAENLAPPEITLTISSTTAAASQPQPVASHTLSSSNHQKPIFIPPTTTTTSSTSNLHKPMLIPPTTQDMDCAFTNIIPSMTVSRSDQPNGQWCDGDRRPTLAPFTNGFFPIATSEFSGLFSRENNVKADVVERSQQTTPKESLDIATFQDTESIIPYNKAIVNTAVPPLPRLSSTVTDVSSNIASPDILSSGASTRTSQISAVADLKPRQEPELIEDQQEPSYHSDFEESQRRDNKSDEDTDAPSISSAMGEKPRSERGDSESARLIIPNVDLFSNAEEKSEWSWKRGSGDGEFRTQETAQETVQARKDPLEIGRLFNPSALKLQFQAELNILDSFNESLCHVMEVEKVRAVALARQQALLGTVRESGQTTSAEIPPRKSDKAVSSQKSLPPSSAEISSINYTRGSATPPSFQKDFPDVEPVALQLSNAEEVRTETKEKDTDGISTESPISPVETSQPSSVPEKSASPQSSDMTISEDIKSQEQSVARSHFSPRVKALKRLKLRPPSDKTSADSLSKASKVVSIEDNADPSQAAVNTDSSRPREGGGAGRPLMEKNERHVAVPGPATSEDAFQFTLQMLEQLMYEEELRVQHKRTLLKLRERVLCDMAKAECASLDLDKKKLRDIGGQEEQISALRKKQRGVLMKFQQQREEINAMQRTDELVWKERRLMYLRQLHLFRMQMSTRSLQNKRDDDVPILLKGPLTTRGILDHRTTGSRRDLEGLMDLNDQSASVSSASVGSDTIPSVNIPVNTSNGDTESSCLDERPLIKDPETRSRNSRDKESTLDHIRQPAEQLNFWRRHLEEEERRLRDVERQGHTRHRPLHMKHSSRDRSTSPFPESLVSISRSSASNSKQRISRPVSNGSGVGSGAEDHSVPEDIADPEDSKTSSIKEAASAAAVSESYTNESFESIESDVKTANTQSANTQSANTQSASDPSAEIRTQSNASNDAPVRKAQASPSDGSNEVASKQLVLNEKSPGQASVTIKIPLSPRLQRVQRRRYSSGSDESIIFSQTETGSEQSDIEGRISALTEQLQQRKTEADRLRKEAKRTRCERLLAKEQSLLKQLQAYDVYISQARQNLDAELKQTNVPIVRPQIKQPRVAAAGKVKTTKTSLPSDQDVSIHDSVAESSASQDSSLDAVLSPNKQNVAELEFMLPEQSAAKDVISDAMSTVASELASGDISEVSSENGSSESNEIASLVANMGCKDEVIVKNAVSDVEAETLSNVGSDAANEATDVLSEMDSLACTEEALKKSSDVTKEEVSDPSKQSEESNEVSSSPSSVQSDSVPTEKADASDSSDVEDLIEAGADASFIKVIFKEKEKDLEEKIVSSPLSETESPISTQDQHSELVERITESILETLLNDCLQKTVKVSSNSNTPQIDTDKPKLLITAQAENFFDTSADETPSHQEKKAKDVRTRVHEILAETTQSPSSRTEPRIQDLLVTTYDILSPDESPSSSPHQGSPTRQGPDLLAKAIEESENRVLAQIKTAEAAAALLGGRDLNSSPGNFIFNDASLVDWFDEDCGASEREAELLRLQELKIEQRIQQLDQAIDQIPYILREIPNKPPPPYTPPGQAPRVLATSVPCSPPLEEIRAVTKDQNEIIYAVTTAADLVYQAHCRNEDLELVTPPESFLMEGYSVPEHVKLCEQDLQIHKNSAVAYRRFLFDLGRQIVEEAYSHEQEEDCPPWLEPENAFSKRKALAEAPRSKQDLQKTVFKRVLALFGFGPRAEKENLTIRWSRKKRDHVDELLVRELQEEERQWTSYEYDEAIVKNKVAESILEALLVDTTEVLKAVYQRRLERKTARSMSN